MSLRIEHALLGEPRLRGEDEPALALEVRDAKAAAREAVLDLAEDLRAEPV